jgi:hypothetical protein
MACDCTYGCGGFFSFVLCIFAGQHQLAKFRLGQEPSVGRSVVAIRFTLPSGQRLQRRFFVDEPVQSIFDYLQTIDELVQVRYDVQSVVGNQRLGQRRQWSLGEAGVTVNTSMVVVIVDWDDLSIRELLQENDHENENENGNDDEQGSCSMELVGSPVSSRPVKQPRRATTGEEEVQWLDPAVAAAWRTSSGGGGGRCPSRRLEPTIAATVATAAGGHRKRLRDMEIVDLS